MSELRPGSGYKTGLSKAADLKKTQELAREEKVGGIDMLWRNNSSVMKY